MDVRLTRLLYGSYAGILITLVGGALAMPGVFLDYPHNGISLWGNYFPAIIPYSIGFTVTATCMLYAAYILPGAPEQLAVMRRLLVAVAAGLVLLLLTPEEVSTVLYWAHMFAAVYLFVIAGLGAIWIRAQGDGWSGLDRLLFWTLMAGSAMSFLSVSVVSVLGVLALGQVLALNAGVLLIVRATLRWTGRRARILSRVSPPDLKPRSFALEERSKIQVKK